MSTDLAKDAGTQRDMWLNDQNQYMAMRRLAMADYLGVPGPPAGCGIDNSTTVNNFPSPSAAGPATSSQPALPSVPGPVAAPVAAAAGLLSNPLVGGLLLGLGGPALVAGGALLHSSGLLGNGSTASPATPTAAVAPVDQAVSVGIDATGRLVIPTDPAN